MSKSPTPSAVHNPSALLIFIVSILFSCLCFFYNKIIVFEDTRVPILLTERNPWPPQTSLQSLKISRVVHVQYGFTAELNWAT